jgi:hypothetical protein
MAKKPRDYAREYREYHGTPAQIKNRAQRNAARAVMAKAGRVAKGDGKDVGHLVPIDRGGTNAKGNLAVQTRKKNRGYKRDRRNNPI